MRQKIISLLAVLVAAVAAVQWAGLTAAGATTCPGTETYDQPAQYWSNGFTYTSVNGIRAPIQDRFSGTVCGGGAGPGFTAIWIGIEPSSGAAITQAGIDHHSITMGQEYCKFWATGEGSPNLYDCGGLPAGGTYNFFEITGYTDPSSHAYLYDVEDCNTSGWGAPSCVTAGTPDGYGNAWAVEVAETNYGGSPCTLQLMGSSTGIDHIGSTANPIQYQNGEGAAWANQPLDGHTTGTCGDYKSDFSNTVYGSYDSRN